MISFLKTKLKNKKVKHKIFGEGYVLDIDIKKGFSGEELFLLIEFEEDNSRREICYHRIKDKNILSFIDKVKIEYYLYLIDNKISIDEIEGDTENDSSVVLKEDELIDILASKILKKESIIEDLINNYNNHSFEESLYENGFSAANKIMNGNNDLYIKSQSIVLLTYIALKYYDGGLYHFVDLEYEKYYLGKGIERKIKKSDVQNIIYSSCDWYKDEIEYSDKKSFIAVPLVLACVPHYRMTDLFNLSYDIYKKKLLYSCDFAYEEICNKVKDLLIDFKNKDIVGDSDQIKVKGTEYKMSRYTQSIIKSGKGIDELVKIISNCIIHIINYLRKPEGLYSIPEFYKEGFNDFIKIFELKEREKYNSRLNISNPKFKLKNDSVYLYTGEYILDESINLDNIYMKIYNNDIEYLNIDLTKLNSISVKSDDDFFGYKVNRQEIKLDFSYLDKLSYSIFTDQLVLYNSGERLYKKHIFFDEHGNEVKQGTNYDGIIQIVSEQKIEEEYEIIDIKEMENGYYLTQIEINSKDVYKIGNETYLFSKISSPKILGYIVPWVEFVSYENQHKKYPIYKDITILFSSHYDLDELAIMINDDIYFEKRRYGELSYNLKLYSSNEKELNVYQLKIFKISFGYKKIKIINKNNNEILKDCKFNIIIDNNIDKTFLEDNGETITSELKCSYTAAHLICQNYDEPVLTEKCYVPNIGFGEMEINKTHISYSIDGNEWLSLKDSLNLSSISNTIDSIKICGPTNLFAMYECKENGSKGVIYLDLEENKGMYSLKLKQIKQLDEGIKQVLLIFSFGKTKQPLKVYYNPFIEKKEQPLIYNKENEEYILKISFSYANKVFYRINPLNSNEVLYEGWIGSNEEISIPSKEKISEYKYVVVSLYRNSYKSLFGRKLTTTPFLIFPRTVVNEAEIIDFSVNFDYLTKEFFGKAKFIGIDKLVVRLKSKGCFIEDKPIYNDERFSFKMKHLLYDEYDLCIVRKIIKDDCEKYIELTKSIKFNVQSELIKQTKNIVGLKYGNLTFSCEYLVSFDKSYKYEYFDGKSELFLFGNILNLSCKPIIKYVYFKNFTFIDNRCEIDVFVYDKSLDTLVPIKDVNGKIVNKIIIEI